MRVTRPRDDHVAADPVAERFGGVERDDAPVVDDEQPVAAIGVFHQVGGDQDGQAILGPRRGQVVPEVDAGAGVETSRRLVEQDEGGSVHQSLGEIDPPLHAARERFHPVVLALPHGHPVEHPVDARFERGAAHAVEVPLVAHVLAHREFCVEARRLEDHADVLAHRLGRSGDVVAGDAGRATRRCEQRRQDAEERRLSAAVGPEQAEDLAAVHSEGEAGERLRLPVGEREVGDFEDVTGRLVAVVRIHGVTLSRAMRASSTGR